MRNPKQVLAERYSQQPVNIQFKASNLFYVLIVVTSATLLMSLMHVILGRFSNLTSSLPAFIISLVCIGFLLGGRYWAISTIYSLVVGLTPFTIMLVQAIDGYRDLYLYFFLGVPVLVLGVLTGYARWQLWILAGEIFVGGLVYYFVYLIPRIKASSSELISGLVFALIYFGLTTVLLSISSRVEKRIIDRLQTSQLATDNRLAKMGSVIGNSQKALAIGQELAGLAHSSAEASATIKTGAAGIQTDVDGLLIQIAENAAEGKRLENSRQKVKDEMQKQSRTVQASSAAIEEMTASIAVMSSSAAAKQTLANELETRTSEAEKAFVSTMTSFSRLEASSKQVLEVMKVIQEIAERTNLLAMNAAIEAAHAGDSGRGFAVVASEIRKLAVETNTNSRAIGEIIARNDADIHSAIKAGTENRQAFEAIRNSIGSVKDALSEILTGMTEVSLAGTEITSSVQDLQDVQRGVTVSVDEMHAILEETARHAVAIENAAHGIGNRTTEISQTTAELSQSNKRLLEIGKANEVGARSVREGLEGLN